MHKNEDDKKSPIGVFSYQGHAGVTHLALMMASYFSSKKGRTVWYLELENQYCIEGICSALNGRYIGKRGEFVVDRITFFPNLTIQKATAILNRAPGIVLIDFGVMTPEKENLLKSCQKRFLMSDLSLWKQEKYLEIFFEKMKRDGKVWDKNICFFGKRYAGKVAWKTKEKIEVLKPVDTPFTLRKEDVSQILRLLN